MAHVDGTPLPPPYKFWMSLDGIYQGFWLTLGFLLTIDRLGLSPVAETNLWETLKLDFAESWNEMPKEAQDRTLKIAAEYFDVTCKLMLKKDLPRAIQAAMQQAREAQALRQQHRQN